MRVGIAVGRHRGQVVADDLVVVLPQHRGLRRHAVEDRRPERMVLAVELVELGTGDVVDQ